MPISLYIHLSVCVGVCISIFLSISVYICRCISISLPVSVRPYLCLILYLCLSLSASISPSKTHAKIWMTCARDLRMIGQMRREWLRCGRRRWRWLCFLCGGGRPRGVSSTSFGLRKYSFINIHTYVEAKRSPVLMKALLVSFCLAWFHFVSQDVVLFLHVYVRW